MEGNVLVGVIDVMDTMIVATGQMNQIATGNLGWSGEKYIFKATHRHKKNFKDTQDFM